LGALTRSIQEYCLIGDNFIIPLLNIFSLGLGWLWVWFGWFDFGSLKYELITIKQVKKLKCFII
tara:strand:+ start:680 stop:871 length:192 start_codon:yes stop_codon:yes gene_type:complete